MNIYIRRERNNYIQFGCVLSTMGDHPWMSMDVTWINGSVFLNTRPGDVSSLLWYRWPSRNSEFSHENSMVDLSTSLCGCFPEANGDVANNITLWL